jgi:PIN domain nuclease of toxin-antitoxin system
MSFLIDSNAWIWLFDEDQRIRKPIQEMLESDSEALYISMASIWEVTIKVGIKKLQLKYDLENELLSKIDEFDITILPLSFQSIFAVKNLPPIHGDPFDRIQVCQAQEHGLEIVSADPIFEKYGIKRHW